MSLVIPQDAKKQRRKKELAAIKKKLQPTAEQAAKQAQAEEFWSDPCWSEPLDSE